MAKIAVVIPYFQRQPGILRKALESIRIQTHDGELDIIIVDDASPVPARDEVAAVPPRPGHKVRIIEQANAGPAAARNKALDNIAPGTEYVAFLDSDDAWTEVHLANAMDALERGHDFYFSDFYQLNQSVSAFVRAKRIKVEEHRSLGPAHLHAYSASMQDQILRGNIVGTPTVVYRYAKFPALRFREEFVYAGEDYLFWLDLSNLSDKVVFSSACEVICGAGVNIFSGSGWGTEKSLIRLHHEMKFKKATAQLYKLTDEQRQHTDAGIAALRKSFVADVMHRLIHRKPLDKVPMKQFKLDPRSFFYFIPIALGLYLKR